MPQQLVNDTQVVVSATNTVVLPVRRTRVSLVLTNISTAGQTITIRRGETPATSGEGIILQVGQSWAETDDAGYRCWRGSVQAAASADAATLAVSEMMVIS